MSVVSTSDDDPFAINATSCSTGEVNYDLSASAAINSLMPATAGVAIQPNTSTNTTISTANANVVIASDEHNFASVSMLI